MSDTEHGISTQAYICPVCFDDHSTGPHRFTDEELAARDARLRAEIGAKIRAFIITGPDACHQPGDPCRLCGAIERTYNHAASIAEGKP